jgi:hypothetical protein
MPSPNGLTEEEYVAIRYASPEIPYSEVDILWADDYYDGPLSGMARYDNKLYWFDFFDEGDDRHRHFSLSSLTFEQRNEELQRQIYNSVLSRDGGAWCSINVSELDAMRIDFGLPLLDINNWNEYKLRFPEQWSDLVNFDDYGYRHNPVIGWFRW